VELAIFGDIPAIQRIQEACLRVLREGFDSLEDEGDGGGYGIRGMIHRVTRALKGVLALADGE
jgi:hypothetical protein